MIRTYGTGVHGRYVADVLYLPGVADADQVIEKGRFLNQELLEADYGDDTAIRPFGRSHKAGWPS